jgi:hypothetical protein
MNDFNQHQPESPNISNRVDAGEAIEEFFTIYHLVEAKEELLSIKDIFIKKKICLSEQRFEELGYFCEKLKALIEAAHQFRKFN